MRSFGTARAILGFGIITMSLLLGAEGTAQPKPRRPGLAIKQIGIVAPNSIRIRLNPATNSLYVLQQDGTVNRVTIGPGDTATFTTVVHPADHGLSDVLGLAFGQDGTMFLVGNDSTGVIGTASIARGIPISAGSDTRTWSRIATTVPYPYGHVYNHRMSGIIVNPNGDSIYVNSGAATDHGELREGNREVGLTSILLKLPVNGQNILLQDDREWLRTNGYLYAEGIRNTFDLAYAGNGDLFGVDNSGDRDDPDELNWIQEGHHYGFPWRMGNDITPQQFTPYDPRKDPLLNPLAWGGGNLYVTFSNDSTYPPPPANVTFDDPVPSSGPDADDFRDTTTGAVQNASTLGLKIATFTPHRSPDGIVFDRDSLLSGDLKGGAFVISLSTSAPLVALRDTSQDLALVTLTKSGDAYSATVKRLVSGFNSPLGIELDTNRLFVLETGLEAYNPSPKLWEITLPTGSTTGVTSRGNAPAGYALLQNYPNPFNPSTSITFSLPKAIFVRLEVFNILGQHVQTLVNAWQISGFHSIQWEGIGSDGKPVASGVYLCRLAAGGQFTQTMKMILNR